MSVEQPGYLLSSAKGVISVQTIRSYRKCFPFSRKLMFCSVELIIKKKKIRHKVLIANSHEAGKTTQKSLCELVQDFSEQLSVDLPLLRICTFYFVILILLLSYSILNLNPSLYQFSILIRNPTKILIF